MHQHWCFTHTGKSSLPVNMNSAVCTNTCREIFNQKKADRRWILVEIQKCKKENCLCEKSYFSLNKIFYIASNRVGTTAKAKKKKSYCGNLNTTDSHV